MLIRNITTQFALIRVAVLACCLGVILTPFNLYAEEPLTIGIFPRRSATTTLELFTPLVDYLSNKLNRKVVLATAPDFASFWNKVANREYDLVHYNQYHYLRSRKMFGYRVILRNEEFGRSAFAGALVARKDSGVDDVADLKGKKIVFGGGRMAMISYIVATDLLREGGLGEGDYLTQFALTPPKACIATYYRQAAAAGAGDGILQLPSVAKQIDTDEMTLIAISKPLAHLPWAVSGRISQQLADQIQTTLAHMNQQGRGKQILANAGLTGLVVTSDSDYNPHREIVQRVLGEQY